MKIRMAILYAIVPAFLAAACAGKTSSVAPSQTGPIISASVAAAREPGGVVVPGGPEVLVTVKNNSSEPVVALRAFLTIPSATGKPYTFDFGMSVEKPLLPGASTGKAQVLIGGGYDSTTPYPLGVSGTLQSGRTFTEEFFVLINTTVTLPATTAPAEFSFVFKYGLGPEPINELDTAHGIFRKDMVMAPPVSTALVLTREEMAAVYLKMQEIDFWSYPDTFMVPTGPMVTAVTPSEKFYFRVKTGSGIKELFWDNKLLSGDPQAFNLKSLIRLIKEIIGAKPEYQSLPPASGGYL